MNKDLLPLVPDIEMADVSKLLSLGNLLVTWLVLTTTSATLILSCAFGADCMTRIVIYKALCFDVAQGRMNGAPDETRTHSCRFASLAC